MLVRLGTTCRGMHSQYRGRQEYRTVRIGIESIHAHLQIPAPEDTLVQDERLRDETWLTKLYIGIPAGDTLASSS